ncbi:126_t:CDS:1 [Gigaspora margarita]|uniref:126_t:CDS:1 n=1 Tax=Gigaspora margarita TaxID=4874 RepID=A0ABN7UV11_GIGMA|nr:126_t:CDS:1 [Gigaspora margarita]
MVRVPFHKVTKTHMIVPNYTVLPKTYDGSEAFKGPKVPEVPIESGTPKRPKESESPKGPGAPAKVAVTDVYNPGVIQFHFSFSDYGEKTIILGLFNLFHCNPKELNVSTGKINLNQLHEFSEALENSQIVGYGYGSPAIHLYYS